MGCSRARQRDQAVDACIALPETAATYRQLIERFADAAPDVDDLLVYTYDQEAWLCGEFGACPRCRGLPLHERLPAFLAAITSAWASKRPAGRLWWEPWELSAGQTLMMVDRLPASNFGLMLHATITEVMTTQWADTWLRSIARMAEERSVPVVVELFLSGANEEVAPLQRVAMPWLVFEAVDRVRQVDGVVSVKEYFGLRPELNDPNLEMAGTVFKDPPSPATPRSGASSPVTAPRARRSATPGNRPRRRWNCSRGSSPGRSAAHPDGRSGAAPTRSGSTATSSTARRGARRGG